MIENAEPGGSEEFSVVLSRFDYPLAGIIDPHFYKCKDSGVQFCRFYLGSYIADIKIDHNPTPKPYSDFIMTRDKPLNIVYRDFSQSKEFQLVKMLLGIHPI